MSFEKIGFASLFHSAFQVDSGSLVAYLALENEIRPYAERVLLARLALGCPRPAVPAVSRRTVQARFDAIRVELDYRDAQRTRTWLEECHVTPEAIYAAIERQVAVDILVDRFIAGLASDPSGREEICQQAFLDLGLRAHVVRAVGLGLLANAGGNGGRPAADAIAAAREHFVLRHGCENWQVLVRKLRGTWGLGPSIIERFVMMYAAAVEAASSRSEAVPNVWR